MIAVFDSNIVIDYLNGIEQARAEYKNGFLIIPNTN